ncbi:hypothetical protein ACO0LB_00340 [Undibacterium sp. SXout7W]|uniref:hypothetical protein n=1 Tax=Undibacterium sp. SXout7W TaxID=3413049 RepID=UPI003BF0E562
MSKNENKHPHTEDKKSLVSTIAITTSATTSSKKIHVEDDTETHTDSAKLLQSNDLVQSNNPSIDTQHQNDLQEMLSVTLRNNDLLSAVIKAYNDDHIQSKSISLDGLDQTALLDTLSTMFKNDDRLSTVVNAYNDDLHMENQTVEHATHSTDVLSIVGISTGSSLI